MNLTSISLMIEKILGQRLYRIFLPKAWAFVGQVPVLNQFLKRKLLDIRSKDRQIDLVDRLMPVTLAKAKTLQSMTIKELADKNAIFSSKLINYFNNSFDPLKKTVAIFYIGSGYMENLGNIPQKLQQKGYNVLLLVGDSPMQVKALYYEIGKKTKIHACICVGLFDGMPDDTKLVYFVHDIHDSPLTNLEKIHRLLPKCNYVVVPSDPAFKRYREKVVEGRDKFYKTGGKPVCFIPAGYPKLDSNLRYLQSAGISKNKTIVYATTITEDIVDLVSLPKHGSNIVEAILSDLPEYKLIFRPHPGTLGTKEVSSVVRKFSKNSRFKFDSNASFYMENYAKASLMVSDLSGTAFTYSFTTLRPVVFFSHNETGLKDRFGSYGYYDDRRKLGYVAENEEVLIERILALLSNHNVFENQIKKFRDSLIYNIGKSEDYFVDNFVYIIEDKKHPDWFYI